MALNSSPVRSDIVYLRRRVKPSPSVEPVVAQAAATAVTQAPALSLSLAPSPPAAPSPSPEPRSATSAGLTLGPAKTAANTAVRAVDPAALPFAAPTIDDLRELGTDHPVLRLNARESAIGSLIVTGAELAAWENIDHVTGSATAAGETDGSPVTTAGNRPLVGFDDADAIVALRHAGELRRALFVGSNPSPLAVQIFDGSTVTVERGNDARTFVLYLLRVGNLVELRAEPVDRSATSAEILAQFGFELTPFVAPRETRSR